MINSLNRSCSERRPGGGRHHLVTKRPPGGHRVIEENAEANQVVEWGENEDVSW